MENYLGEEYAESLEKLESKCKEQHLFQVLAKVAYQLRTIEGYHVPTNKWLLFKEKQTISLRTQVAVTYRNLKLRKRQKKKIIIQDI